MAFFLFVVHELNPSEEDWDFLSEERVDGVVAAGHTCVVWEEGGHIRDDPVFYVCHLIDEYEGLDKWLRRQASVLEVHGLNPAMTWLKITSPLSLPYRR